MSGPVVGYALPAVMVNEVTATLPPAVMLTLFRLRSDADVLTSPSTIAVEPAEFHSRKWEAVPLASADASEVIAFSVSTPPDEDGANVALHVSSASSVPVIAAATFAGRVPL